MIDAVCSYNALARGHQGSKCRLHRDTRSETVEDLYMPVCKQIGVEVIIFRGADRNRRRGFHNLVSVRASG